MKKREVLILSRFQNLKYKEIAEFFDCHIGTVKVLVHRAIKELTIIVDYEKEKLYFCINKLKIYYELPISIDLTQIKEILPPKAAKIISSIQITDVMVNIHNREKRIANWNQVN